MIGSKSRFVLPFVCVILIPDFLNFGQEFPDPTKNLLRIHISAFSRWVLTRLERYPASLQTLLYAIITLVEHHKDLLNISTIVIEMVLKPLEWERRKFQRLHKQLLYFEDPGSFSELFKTYQEYCDTSVGTQRLAVDGDAYAELAVKLAEFLIQTLVSSHPIAFLQADVSISSSDHGRCTLNGPTTRLLTMMRTMIVHPFHHPNVLKIR